MVFKEHAGDARADDIAEVEAEVGEGIGAVALGGGGEIRDERVVGWALDRLEQSRAEDERRGQEADGQYRREAVKHEGRDVKDDDDALAGKAVRELAAEDRGGEAQERCGGDEQRGVPVGHAEAGR